MNKLSFFKGALIGGLFSFMFWGGVIYAVSDSNDNETPQQEIIQEEVSNNTIALL